MPPGHNPEFRDAVGIASLDALDGMATNAITRQLTGLEGAVAEIGGVEHAHMSDGSGETLHGYHFVLDDGTEVNLEIELDPVTCLPIDEDQAFLDARNRFAVLRSRERSRGSRLFNFSFMKNRGPGPGGHGYRLQGIGGIWEQYDGQLAEFIGRKIDGCAEITNQAQTTEAIAHARTQEQRQVRTLERVAAEMKSGNDRLDSLRNRKGLRAVTGGVALAGAAMGVPAVVLPAVVIRSALGAAGGYLATRTGWDALQGWRAERLPHDDIRMAGPHDGDFSGRIRDPQDAFERFIKLNGAEARAGSRDPRRLRLAQALGSTLVREYYEDNVVFGGAPDTKPTALEISDQVWELGEHVINPIEEERLASDQTQSRRRHIAGLVGGLVGATALPAL